MSEAIMEKAKEPEIKEKRQRQRSPNYPAIGLRDAIERVRKLYETDGKAGAPDKLAAVHVGFASAHGQAMTVLAALKKFGLIEPSNGRLVPTQRAIEILNLPETDQRRLQALKDAALSPAIYSELVQQHRETGFPADDVMKSELVTYKGFNRSAVAGFVKDFRDTLDFAGLSDFSKLKYQEEGEKSEVEVGDYVQWNSQGADQFKEARKVTGLSEDGGFVFVSGSSTGIPIEQVKKCDAPTGEKEIGEKGSRITSVPTVVNRPAPKPGMRNDVFTLDEGEVIIQWPDHMSPESYEDFESWLGLIAKKAKRVVRQQESDNKVGGSDE